MEPTNEVQKKFSVGQAVTLLIAIAAVFFLGYTIKSGTAENIVVTKDLQAEPARVFRFCGSGDCVEADQYLLGQYVDGRQLNADKCITAFNRVDTTTIQIQGQFCGNFSMVKAQN